MGFNDPGAAPGQAGRMDHPSDDSQTLHTIWLFDIAMENPLFNGKSSINGPFSMAMINNQMVINTY